MFAANENIQMVDYWTGDKKIVLSNLTDYPVNTDCKFNL